MTNGEQTVVAVDLDDTLFAFARPFFDWHNLRYGTDLGLEDLANSRYLFDAWGGTVEEAADRVPRFFREVDILGLDPISGAVECLRSLRRRYQLVVLSARDPNFAAITDEWLNKHFGGVFDRVILGIGHSERGEGSTTKAEVCRRIGADVLVDDQVAHLAPAADEGIRTLLFGRYPWNQAEPVPPSSVRVADWSQVCAALT